MSDKLIFVYNADGGILNMVKDLIHKNVSPETYACSLCAVTYDNRGMKRKWKQFVSGLEREVEFLHRDELAKRHGITDILLPAAFIHCMDDEPELWLDSKMMNSCKTLDDLEQLVVSRLN